MDATRNGTSQGQLGQRELKIDSGMQVLLTQADHEWDGYPQYSNWIEFSQVGAVWSVRINEKLEIVACERCCLNDFEQQLSKDKKFERSVVLGKSNII